jgi:hypothetical protein
MTKPINMKANEHYRTQWKLLVVNIFKVPEGPQDLDFRIINYAEVRSTVLPTLCIINLKMPMRGKENYET